MEVGYQELLDHISVRKKNLTEVCEEIFSDKNRCVLEIGCGHGDFLNAYAQAHPEKFCVGIDIIGKRIGKCDKKRERLGNDNLCFIKIEALELLEVLPAHVEFEQIFILFPDPWPKTRHHRRRLMQESFLGALAQRCAPGAQLCFRTDHKEYFSATTNVLNQHVDWQINTGLNWPFEHRTFFQHVTSGHQSVIAECLDN